MNTLQWPGHIAHNISQWLCHSAHYHLAMTRSHCTHEHLSDWVASHENTSLHKANNDWITMTGSHCTQIPRNDWVTLCVKASQRLGHIVQNTSQMTGSYCRKYLILTGSHCRHTLTWLHLVNTPEGWPGMSDVSPLSGISGLSFDSTLLSPLLFFCLVLLPFLSYRFLPAGPFF